MSKEVEQITPKVRCLACGCYWNMGKECANKEIVIINTKQCAYFITKEQAEYILEQSAKNSEAKQ